LPATTLIWTCLVSQLAHFWELGFLAFRSRAHFSTFPSVSSFTLAGPFTMSGDVPYRARHGLVCGWQYQRGLGSSPAASLLDDITANFFDLRSLGMSREQDDVVEPGATGVCIYCLTIGTAIGSVGDDCMKFQFNRARGCQ